MSRCELVVELATAHGGNVALAADMIKAAADAGADTVKLQTYSLQKLNPRDPQADWLRQAHLDEGAHEHLMGVAHQAGLKFLSTPFDRESLTFLRSLGCRRFKIASSESGHTWWRPMDHEWGEFIVSYPWGRLEKGAERDWILPVTAIPLYPTPLECVEQANLLQGWSDHCEGLSASFWALSHGVRYLEVHLALPGISREKVWDKSPVAVKQLREHAEACATMLTGVGQTFRDRWSKSA